MATYRSYLVIKLLASTCCFKMCITSQFLVLIYSFWRDDDSLLFLLAGCRNAHLPPVVPVPLRDLMECHTDFFCNLNLPSHRPLWILVEVFQQYLHLLRLLTHASSLFPLVDVLRFKLKACFHLVLTHTILGAYLSL